jgi:hypothetical protein
MRTARHESGGLTFPGPGPKFPLSTSLLRASPERRGHTKVKVDSAVQEDARQALLEMQRYLADEIAPMMAVDAASALLRMPPKYGAAAIQHWLEDQLRSPNQAVTVSRYLYHAVKKFHLFSEFDLIDKPAMDRYVAGLSRLVLKLCPDRERDELALRLSRIGETKTTLSAPVQLLNREMGSETQEEQIRQAQAQAAHEQSGRAGGQGPAPVSPRMSMLMGRLRELNETKQEGASNKDAQEVLARAVSKAALEARDSAQFDASLARIRKMGADPKFDRVFRMLGERLPGWDVESKQAQAGADAALGHLLQAMHQIVALAGTREDGIERFSEMVYTAIEQFNEGHLAQAVAMFDVAQRLIEKGKVDTDTAGLVRTRAQGSVSTSSLRQFASTPAKHALLRRVLAFFPVFTPDQLLKKLDGEPKREMRKLMLSLIEVHGQPCRPLLLERLGSYLSGVLSDPNGYYTRNTVFLLRRIPRGPEDDQQLEFNLLTEFSRPDRPFMITKEAVGALANLSLPKAEKVLIDRMSEFEQEALSGDPIYGPEEMLEILDRTCAALAQLATPKAIHSVVEHAYRKEPELGQTLGRLQHLAGCDLAHNHEQLQRICDTLRKMLPAKILGMVLGRRMLEVSYLVRTLSGTSDPGVHELLEAIVERYPDQDFAEQARVALSAVQAKPGPEPAQGEELSGDLEVFGLPTLLQSMAGSELTGRLVILERNGSERANVYFSGGKIHHCEVGRLRGLDAMCQLFERPRSATFRFEKVPPSDLTPQSGEMLDVTSVIMEAMRRHDEFQEDRALVPDGTSLMPTQAPKSLPEKESDVEFANAVWREAARGTAPETCEGAVNGDAYRVRQLYAHWLECGALERRPAA